MKIGQGADQDFFGNSDNGIGMEINFDNKLSMPKIDYSSPNAKYNQLSFELTNSQEKNKNEKKEKDPFDFIVF